MYVMCRELGCEIKQLSSRVQVWNHYALLSSHSMGDTIYETKNQSDRGTHSFKYNYQKTKRVETNKLSPQFKKNSKRIMKYISKQWKKRNKFYNQKFNEIAKKQIKTAELTNKEKSWFFEKINNIDRPLENMVKG